MHYLSGSFNKPTSGFERSSKTNKKNRSPFDIGRKMASALFVKQDEEHESRYNFQF